MIFVFWLLNVRKGGGKRLVNYLVLIRTRPTCSPSFNRHVYLYRKTFQHPRQRLQKPVFAEQISKNRFLSWRSAVTVLSALHTYSICINITIHYVTPSFTVSFVSRVDRLRQQTENLKTIRVFSSWSIRGRNMTYVHYVCHVGPVHQTHDVQRGGFFFFLIGTVPMCFHLNIQRLSSVKTQLIYCQL